MGESPDGLDAAKLNYFLAKYKAATSEELAEAAGRVDELSDEAAAGLRQAVQERGVQLADIAPKTNEPDLVTQTKMSSELWNSSLSRRIPLQCGMHGILFSNSLLGSTGLNVGALWLVLLAAALYYVASKVGKSYTRSVCADGSMTVDAKRKELRSTSYLLWPSLLIAVFLGVALANAIRGL